MKSIAICIIALTYFITLGFITPTKFNPGKEFSRVPSGELTVGESKKTIQSFYIQKTEVTNRQYKEFLNSLLAEGKKEAYEKAKIESSGWQKHSNYLANNYHTELFDEYPVVNITREGTLLYCKWLTDKLNKETDIPVIARLPMEEEWIYAAMGGIENAVMPWGSPSFCNTKGNYLLNFSVDSSAREMCMAARTPSGKSKDEAKLHHLGNIAQEERTMFTAPAVSYWANNYGLYNMCGNVAEMIAEDGRTKGGSWENSGKHVWIRSSFDAYKDFNGPSPGMGFRPVITYLGK